MRVATASGDNEFDPLKFILVENSMSILIQPAPMSMQQEWRDSDDKCTFIVLDRKMLEKGANEEDAMVGDTNIFLSTEEDGVSLGEAEIMIAESAARGKGFGWEAMCLMLR